MSKCICGECDHLQASYTWIPDYCEFYIEPHDNKCEKFKPLPPKPPTKDEIIKSLEKELAELKEKYRWHDSRVEKIPQSVSILHCPVYEIRAVLPSGSSHLFEAVMIAEDLICEAKNFDYYYWRLLDELPKEDVRP